MLFRAVAVLLLKLSTLLANVLQSYSDLFLSVTPFVHDPILFFCSLRIVLGNIEISSVSSLSSRATLPYIDGITEMHLLSQGNKPFKNIRHISLVTTICIIITSLFSGKRCWLTILFCRDWLTHLFLLF